MKNDRLSFDIKNFDHTISIGVSKFIKLMPKLELVTEEIQRIPCFFLLLCMQLIKLLSPILAASFQTLKIFQTSENVN
jgi:hypothetical protein